MIDEPERYRSILVKTLSQLTLAIWPGIIWAIILADTLVPTLLGKQWVGAEPIFVPLAIAGLVQTINYSAGCMYISQGRSGEFARWSFIGAVVDVASFTIGLPYGAVGVATAYAISEYLRTPFCWWNLTRIGPVRARDVIHAIVPQIVSTLISVLALLAYRHMVELPPFALLAGGLVLSYLTTALAMGVSRNGRKTLKHSLEAVHRVSLHIQTRHTP